MAIFRHRDAQVPAQRAGLVLGPDDAAFAQDGHHLIEEPPELGGVPDVDVGPVQGTLGEPPLEYVRPVCGEPTKGVGLGAEMNCTVCRSVKSLSWASLTIFSAWVRNPRSAACRTSGR